jgi:glycosyltransferase involved in cell wall biosynthesis
MRIHFVLPGLHRVHRGAEVAFESIATEIAKMGLDEVTLVGSGEPIANRPYKYKHYAMLPRERFERFPKFPPFRTEYIYEEATWVFNYLRNYRAGDADLTITCSYPFVNWLLTRWPPRGPRPPHVFVTQNGDWPAYSDNYEYTKFRCDGLVCINPEYYERNKSNWPSVLIPNGIDPAKFQPGSPVRERFGLPDDKPIVLMVSALVESKRVLEGMRAVAKIPDAHLVVAGDGLLREEFDRLGNELMPGRFWRMTLPIDQMPDLYRSADVFLHPTFWESFGNVYVEALATGLPVVAHDYAVTRWIFKEGHPGLVDASDEHLVTGALRKAISNGKSDAVEQAPIAATRFSWKNIANDYRSFFEDVIKRQRRVPL